MPLFAFRHSLVAMDNCKRNDRCAVPEGTRINIPPYPGLAPWANFAAAASRLVRALSRLIAPPIGFISGRGIVSRTGSFHGSIFLALLCLALVAPASARDWRLARFDTHMT